MPNVIRIISPFIQGGNPDTMNVAQPTQLTGGGNPPGSFFPYAGGDLGASFDYNDKTYEVVQLDSGATASTGIGVVAANQLAFWKSKALRLVTNDFTQAITPSVPDSCVAGVFRTAVTAGNLCCILCRGANITVSAGTTAIGPVAADTTASTARVITATGVHPVIGQARTANAAGVATVDVDIPTLP